MAELVLDVVEQKILVRLDAEDLIRCKSVCKSWHSLISSPRFVKAHLNHAYTCDRDNPELGHRRIGLPKKYYEDTWFNYYDGIHIVGSCNGLLCISPIGVNFVVTNPLTREHRELPLPPYRPRIIKGAIIREAVYWGFGYDSSADDYKVIAGFKQNGDSKWMLFYVLTLKSNAWKYIGRIKYCIDEGRSGILCGGALHWFMIDQRDKKVIIALDLSTEKFKKIPLSDFDLAYACDRYEHRLGVIEECLCIYSISYPLYNKWVMKHDKWELYVDDHCKCKHDLVHYLQITSRLQMNLIDCVDGGNRLPVNGDYIRACLFVKSLVSPYSLDNNNNDHSTGQKKNAKEEEDSESVESRANGNKRKRK